MEGYSALLCTTTYDDRKGLIQVRNVRECLGSPTPRHRQAVQLDPGTAHRRRNIDPFLLPAFLSLLLYLPLPRILILLAFHQPFLNPGIFIHQYLDRFLSLQLRNTSNTTSSHISKRDFFCTDALCCASDDSRSVALGLRSGTARASGCTVCGAAAAARAAGANPLER